MGEILGDRLIGLDAEVFKVRVRNSDASRGKSGGYRIIYWLKLPECVVLVGIATAKAVRTLQRLKPSYRIRSASAAHDANQSIITGFIGVSEDLNNPETSPSEDDR